MSSPVAGSLRSARGQADSGVYGLPPPDGSTLQRLLTDPDTVSLEHISLETINVSDKRARRVAWRVNLSGGGGGSPFGRLGSVRKGD